MGVPGREAAHGGGVGYAAGVAVWDAAAEWSPVGQEIDRVSLGAAIDAAATAARARWRCATASAQTVSPQSDYEACTSVWRHVIGPLHPDDARARS